MKILNKYIYVALVLSIVSILFLSKGILDAKKSLKVMTNNFNEIGVKQSTLRLKNSELKTYISNKDTKHKIEVDSILKAHKVKIKNLKSYQSIKTEIVYVDTSRVLPIEIKPISETLYRVDFLKSSKCITVSGHLNTLDKDVEIYISSMRAVNNIYITKSYKKSFWDCLFFRKGREVITTTSDCDGEVSSNLIEVD